MNHVSVSPGRVVGTARVRQQPGVRLTPSDMDVAYEPVVPTGNVYGDDTAAIRRLARHEAATRLSWWGLLWRAAVALLRPRRGAHRRPEPTVELSLPEAPVSPTVYGPRMPHTCHAARSRPCHACDIANDAAFERSQDR